MTIGEAIILLLLFAGGAIAILLAASLIINLIFSIPRLSRWRDRQIEIIEHWQREDD